MINRRNRFHGYGSLKKIYSNGKTIRGGQIGVKFLSKGTDKPYRLAVVVSKKVHKSAVSRNRVRRKIYEAVRTSANQPKNGTDIILTIFSDQIVEMPSDKLKKIINDLLQKIK